MKTLAKFALLLCGFALTIYLTSYISRLPESNCVTSEVSHLWSDDQTYKAQLLKKDCNMGETSFYSVRIDKSSTPSDRGWFLIQNVEQDGYPAIPPEPTMVWDSHRLRIEIPAEELSGSIEYRPKPHVSLDDLTIVRSYIGGKP